MKYQKYSRTGYFVKKSKKIVKAHKKGLKWLIDSFISHAYIFPSFFDILIFSGKTPLGEHLPSSPDTASSKPDSRLEGFVYKLYLEVLS
jgi:hypothetical protein